MLSNICATKPDLILHFNAGSMSVTKKGDPKGFGTVWYLPNDIANFLSLRNLKKKYRATYDSEMDDIFVVHMENVTKRIF